MTIAIWLNCLALIPLAAALFGVEGALALTVALIGAAQSFMIEWPKAAKSVQPGSDHG